jgi:hypothetical protein
MENFEQTIALNADVIREINKKCEDKIEKLRAQKGEEALLKTTDIKDVGAKELFSAEAFWQLTNLKTLAEFEIPGTAVVFYLAGKNAVREMLERGEIDAFEQNNFYIKFKCLSHVSNCGVEHAKKESEDFKKEEKTNIDSAKICPDNLKKSEHKKPAKKKNT